MTMLFSQTKCQQISQKKRFGICDDVPPPHRPAYIDETDGTKWIAVVTNEDRLKVTFTAIDHCIETKSINGKMAKRCDGALTFDTTIAFVELKEREEKGNNWIKEAEEQLRSTIRFFEKINETENFRVKKAYIANNKRPRFRESQRDRMDQFLKDTGYVLRIENRIVVE